MKKIILSCSVLLVLSLLIVSFAGCGDKTDNNSTTKASDDNVVSTGYTAEISTDSAVIKKDGVEFQTVKYPINPGFSFDLEYAKENYEFKDMNFDGVPDFYIATSNEDGIINFFCWLFNDTTKQFDYSSSLSALKNISVDAENHCIYSKVVFKGTERVVCYRWVNGVLKLDAQYDTATDTIPAEITQAVQNNAIGSNKKPANTDKTQATTAVDKNNKPQNNNNASTTKKPATATTTIVNTNSDKSDNVSLATGDIDEGWF